MPAFFPGMVRAFTLTQVINQHDFTPKWTLLDPTHIGACHWMALRFQGGGDINMSSSNWKAGEIHKLRTIMGEKVMQSHLTKTGKDGAIYVTEYQRNFTRLLSG